MSHADRRDRLFIGALRRPTLRSRLLHRSQPTMPRAFFRALAALSLVLFVALSLAACDSAAPETTTAAVTHAAAKTEVCHATGSETNPYELITVADAAYPAHVEHGDASPGEAVPGQEGFVFDDACQPVATCPCFDAEDLAALTFVGFSDNASGDGRTTTLLNLRPGQTPPFDLIIEAGAVVGTNDSGALICALIEDDVSVSQEEGIAPAQAEACRVLIYDAADDEGLTCDGDACGQSYTP